MEGALNVGQTEALQNAIWLDSIHSKVSPVGEEMILLCTDCGESLYLRGIGASNAWKKHAERKYNGID